MNILNNFYKNKKVLITGHTGFKGSWLMKILEMSNAIVKGYSLISDSELNHFELLFGKDNKKYNNIFNYEKLKYSINEFKPDIIFHLAAEAHVIDSYNDPYKTYTTNFLGTLNLLDICRKGFSPNAIVIITTDKVYKDKKININYNELDELGGFDPYSSSKACVELLVSSYKNSFFKKSNTLLATCRAGNCIGGGDFSHYRLIPDIIRTIINKNQLNIRYPDAIRPWQHVLEPLYGYLLLGEKLYNRNKKFSDAWNFGPEKENEVSVLDILKLSENVWNDINYKIEKSDFYETKYLKLDSTKSKLNLKWYPKYNINETIEKTILWYKEYYENNNIITEQQIKEYFNIGE